VIAFEPLPAHLAQLHANLALNDLAGQVEVHPLALSDAPATLRFAPGPKTNRGMAHTIDGPSTGLLNKTPQSEIIEVEARRLDDLLTLLGAPLVIKIDVEGHEGSTLAGMRRTLTDNRSVLQVEVLPEVAAKVSEQLAGIGYRAIGSIGLDHYFTNVSDLKAD
jgi:FkbM family methyltransferase